MPLVLEPFTRQGTLSGPTMEIWVLIINELINSIHTYLLSVYDVLGDVTGPGDTYFLPS